VECINAIEVEDLAFTGCFHTWTNKQEGMAFVSKKLERVLSNLEWLRIFPNTTVEFLECGISDHSPALVNIQQLTSFGPKPFKFFNFWADHGEFLDWVAAGWQIEVEGYAMHTLYSRLRAVKSILKVKNAEVFGGLGLKVERARQDLALAQRGFLNSCGSREWFLKEKECMHQFLSFMTAEENFIKQKS
jgi:hypothetical protein